jgi:SHS family lactate transporter-like MFS transporter
MIAAIVSLPVVPLWAFGTSPIFLAVAAFLMQFMVQSAWGIVPVHLNELSPPAVRGTFPGFVYQLGNLLASVNATIQSSWAAAHGNNFSWALATVAVSAAIAIALLVGFGIEKKGVEMHTEGDREPPSRTVGVLRPQQQE